MMHELSNQFLNVIINDHGAELWSLYDRIDQREVIWQGDPAYWPRRSPILFPWCGAMRGQRFEIGQVTFPADIHGFARDFQHQLIIKESDRLVFELADHQESLLRYPYHFILRTSYELINRSLLCTLEAINPGDTPVPCAMGFHTGFNLPFDQTRRHHDYSLHFSGIQKSSRLLTNDQGLLTGKEVAWEAGDECLNLTPESFDPSIVLQLVSPDGEVKIIEENSKRRLILAYQQARRMVLWSKGHVSPFLCIEPWTGQPDSESSAGQLTERDNIELLMPGHHRIIRQAIRME